MPVELNLLKKQKWLVIAIYTPPSYCKNYLYKFVETIGRTVKTEYLQKHMPHGASSKNFWKFCKLFFLNKTTDFNKKSILVEKGQVDSKNEEIATHSNNLL